MEQISAPARKKPKTPPKPILDQNIINRACEFRQTGRHGWQEKATAKPYAVVSKSSVGEAVRLPGQKPPLLPKPVILHKSSPHVSSLRSRTSVVSSNTQIESPSSLSQVTSSQTINDSEVTNIKTDINIIESEILTSDDIAQTHSNSNLETVTDTEFTEKLHSDENDVCKVNSDGSYSIESQFDSKIDNQNIEDNNTGDIKNVEINSIEAVSEETSESEVDEIVARTWTLLQSNLTSQSTIVRTDKAGTLVADNCDEPVLDNIPKNVSSLYNSLPPELPENSDDTTAHSKRLVASRLGNNKLQPMNSVSELVRSLHSIKVEPQSCIIESVKDTCAENFRSNVNLDSSDDCKGKSSEHLEETSEMCDEFSDKVNNTCPNQSFLHTHERDINNKGKDAVYNRNFDESETQSILTPQVHTNVTQDGCAFQTSTPKLQNGSSSGNSVTMRRHDSKTEDSIRITSWCEDSDLGRSRTDSIGSGGFDGPASVRRRISTWFGSFGKGSKQKEKRESCLFYYDHTESNTATESESESQRTSQISLSDVSTQTLTVPKYSSDTSNYYYDQNSSNRSSVSEESFENEQQSQLDAESRKGSIIDTEIEDPVQRKKRKCFCVANELMTSEKVFIDVLKLICQDFKKFIEDAGKEARNPIIPPSEFNKIISSLPQLLSLNEDLLHDLENRIESWNEVPKIADVIVKKGPFLKLYSTYIQNFEAQTNFLDECCQKYPRFAKALKDFEGSDRCKKLALKHYMLKPIQRIPQYRLLLEDYLGYQDRDSVDYADTQSALQIVCDVANHANRSMKHGDHLSKLLSIQSQLGNYEIIKPGREFVMEGELYKLSRKEMQLRFFILLSDCLLYTSYYGSMTGLRVKNKLPLCGMKVCTSQTEDCFNEFSIITSTRSFTLRARSQEECKAWVNALQNAIKENNYRQMTFLNMKFVPMTVDAEPLQLGREAPVWIQDKRVTMCQVCTAEFTVTFRRHHCRACGKVVCGVCSDNKAPLMYMKFQTARVCEDCYDYLLKEFDDPTSKLSDIVKEAFSISEEYEVASMMENIRNSFKKFGPSSGKKIRKYVPQRLKEVTANDSGSQMSGWMYRRSKKSWKRLWFVLKEQVLYVYKASEDVVALESIPVLGYIVETVKEGVYEDGSGDSRFIFQLMHAGQPPLLFSTDTQQALNRWISAFHDATVLK